MHLYTFFDTIVMMTSVCLVLMELYILTFYLGIYGVFLSNYSSMSATTTIHRSTQLFMLDCVSCTFLGMIGADVEGEETSLEKW